MTTVWTIVIIIAGCIAICSITYTIWAVIQAARIKKTIRGSEEKLKEALKEYKEFLEMTAQKNDKSE